MILTDSILKARPYRYLLLLYDFINEHQFELAHSGEKVTFQFMGNATKFYTPAQFTSYHDVHDALSWMKTNEIHFKHEKLVFTLPTITMPKDYEHGSTSEFYHIFTGLAVLARLKTNSKQVTPADVLKEISSLGDRSIKVGHSVIELDVNVNQATLDIVESPLFRPLLKTEVRYACDYVNKDIVSCNINYLKSLDKYKIKVVIGENRSITTNDIKLFESVNGNYQEIKLDHRNNRKFQKKT